MGVLFKVGPEQSSYEGGEVLLEVGGVQRQKYLGKNGVNV